MNIHFPEISFPVNKALDISAFKKMDSFAVESFGLPVELMMENAGLLLARMISVHATRKQKIRIGIGNGNNGGGGLVSARRLAAWGYQVSLDLYTPITKDLPVKQLDRARKFGVKTKPFEDPDIWVDAYLGFSQRLPLPKSLLSLIEEAHSSAAFKISLDIPTGFLGDSDSTYFDSEMVLTLAAPKSILLNLPSRTQVYVADLGIPGEVYRKFGMDILPFDEGGVIKLKDYRHE